MSKTEKGRAKKALPKKKARAIAGNHAAIKDDPRNQTRIVVQMSGTPGSITHAFPVEGINPKDAMGQKKPDMSLVPPTATLYTALGMENGRKKYGKNNWRVNKVIASIYIAAAKRHLDAWLEGEELAEDSGVPHLGHALATVSILVDALEGGNMVDDRGLPGPFPQVLKKWTKE